MSHCEEADLRSTLASSILRTTIVNNRFRASHYVYNTWRNRRRDDDCARFTAAVVWRQVEREVVFALILYLKPEYLPHGSVWARSECDNRISDANFLILFW